MGNEESKVPVKRKINPSALLALSLIAASNVDMPTFGFGNNRKRSTITKERNRARNAKAQKAAKRKRK